MGICGKIIEVLEILARSYGEAFWCRRIRVSQTSYSALKAMPELKHADLIRFRISTMAELDQILDHLDDWSHPKIR